MVPVTGPPSAAPAAEGLGSLRGPGQKGTSGEALGFQTTLGPVHVTGVVRLLLVRR